MADDHEVLELHFDSDSESLLSNYRRMITAAAPSIGTAVDIGRPHISLTSSTGPSVKLLERQIRQLCAERTSFELTLPNLGIFHGQGKTFFLGVTPSTALLQFHAALHQLMARGEIRQPAFIQPQLFVPHCTLATNLTDEQLHDSIRALAKITLPIRATATSLRLVRYYPSTEVEHFPLG